MLRELISMIVFLWTMDDRRWQNEEAWTEK